jgi:PAS domain S-box-containing protein
MTAGGLAHSNVYLQTKNRRAIAQGLADRFITDQKLTDSEEKFRQIFEQSGDMVVVNNLDTGAILEVNNQFVKRSRVPRELVVGRMDTDFNFFADPVARERFMKELLENGVVHNLEVQLNGIGYGRPMPALISAVVVRLNNQKCAIIVVREISDVREAERKLRNSETTLRKIFDANLDSITTTDAMTRRYTDCNHEFTRATGFSREEVVGKTYWEIGVWPSREESDNFSSLMMRNGEVRNMRANFYAKDGTLIPCLMSGAMVELDGKLSVLTITRNIGDLLAAEQKLKDSEASLRKNLRLDPGSVVDYRSRRTLCGCQRRIHTTQRIFARRDHWDDLAESGRRPLRKRVSRVAPGDRPGAESRSCNSNQERRRDSGTALVGGGGVGRRAADRDDCPRHYRAQGTGAQTAKQRNDAAGDFRLQRR